MPLAHPQQLGRFHTAQFSTAVPPDRFHNPRHPNLLQHTIPPNPNRTDRLLQNPDISRATDMRIARGVTDRLGREILEPRWRHPMMGFIDMWVRVQPFIGHDPVDEIINDGGDVVRRHLSLA